MKFTLSWLQDHLESTASLDHILKTLTMVGLEVEGCEDRGKDLGAFVIGEVIEAEQHPNADKLRVLKVDTGSGLTQVVCGAPNARAGMRGVFAAEGAYIPGTDVTLKKAEIRGVASSGMMLSEREMGLSDEHDGIVELDTDAAPGTTAIEVMGLNDPVIEVAVTPNRGDCLGVRGIARDLAAAGLGRLKELDVKPCPAAFNSPTGIRLDFSPETEDACPYFVGRAFRNVKNGPSPQWLQDRLNAVGLRPISALVDITNYITLDLCRPLHVFDADKFSGDIQVRLAKKDERILGLDEKTYALDETMTVIADQESALAIAGVMGGEESGCGAETTDLFLEVAYFDPVRTAQTGRKLNLQSDARYRFERGVDPAFLVEAAHVASRLILEICGGEASELVIAGAEPKRERDFVLRADRVRRLGGTEVDHGRVKEILETLGCQVSDGKGDLQVRVPSWRPDMVGEADLVEEVLRIHGYDNIPAVALSRRSDLPETALSANQHRHAQARRLLAGLGLSEAVSYSFMSSKTAALFAPVPEALRLINPISSELDVMRPTILPNLIEAVGRNVARGQKDVRLFEVGPVFHDETPEGQEMVAAGVRFGRSGHRNWAQEPRHVDAFDGKADALSLLEGLNAPIANAVIRAQAPAWYHPGRSGALSLGKTVLAHFGEIHPRILRAMGIKDRLIGFELFPDAIPHPKRGKSAARKMLRLSPFQPVERDFAFVVDSRVAAADVMRAARSADKTHITEVRVFDLYEGGSLGEGKKSLAINVVLQPQDKTFVDADFETLSTRIIEAVEKATGGVLRA